MRSSPFITRNIGRLHQGTSRCFIADLPVSYDTQLYGLMPAQETINANITTFLSPGLDMKHSMESSYRVIVHIPTDQDTDYSGKVLTVTMIADDRMENYWALHRYMDTIKSWNRGGFPIMDVKHRVWGGDGAYRNRRMYIPFIEIHNADDSMQKHQIIKFERCWIVTLSDITWNFAEPSPVTFTVSFKYENKVIIRMDPPTENTSPACIVNK